MPQQFLGCVPLLNAVALLQLKHLVFQIGIVGALPDFSGQTRNTNFYLRLDDIWI